MTEIEIKVVLGGLLHDIGEVICREDGDRRDHAQRGHDFLRDEAGIADSEILEAVRYHHADALKGAEPAADSLAYIVSLADRIASAGREGEETEEAFQAGTPLESVFNILNGNDEAFYYKTEMLRPDQEINYPEAERKLSDTQFYVTVRERLLDCLRGMECTREAAEGLSVVSEELFSYVPAPAARGERADISLSDHGKLTGAVAGCIYAYLAAKNTTDYRSVLFDNAQAFCKEDAFLLYSMDVSGIQEFIYTIASKNALRTLRTRSFYLEIMMEHIIDGLLEKLCLSRVNLIYSGGGHCYLLLPNTPDVAVAAETYVEELNGWLLDQFRISLYVAAGYAPCSADALQNRPDGSYAQIFKDIGTMIAAKKSSRYTAEEIRKLNSDTGGHTRECKVCRGTAQVGEDGICPVCQAIERFSAKILYRDYFTVTREETQEALPLPGGYFLAADDEETLRTRKKGDASFVRVYGKNRMAAGFATKLWVGDYTTGKTFEEYADAAEGIRRIGVLRADVDNLGQTFVAGFDRPENHNRDVSLSRTAALSRQLSLFFKFHINRILGSADCSVGGKGPHPREAAICYSGGDDVFIVGAWDEILGLAVDLEKAFRRYTQGTLTLSAGIGMYVPGYPIHVIAEETAAMEAASKRLPGKNAVTLFEDGQTHFERGPEGNEVRVSDGTYGWQEFETAVLGEKYRCIATFFAQSDERGKNFLYRLLELLRKREEKIYFARYVYLLSRLEPDREAPAGQREAYRVFSRNLYRWWENDRDVRQLKTAMALYAYVTREKEGTGNEDQ